MIIKDNTILLIPNLIKNKVIKEVRNKNEFVDVKFMTIDEFRKKYYFTYGNETIYYLMKKYNYKYDVAKVYLNNIYYLKSNVIYNKEKLIKLKKIKEELLKNGLLIKNDMFRNFIKKKNILVYGFDSLDMLDRYTFSTMNNAEIVYNQFGSYKHNKVYEFETLEEEINYVCTNIIELLNSGIEINKIKLLNITNEYNNTLERLFDFYHIPIVINNKVNLYSTNIGLFFIENLNSDIMVTLDEIKGKFNLNNEINLDIYNKIIRIVNDYIWCDNYLSIKDMLENELKNTYLTSKKLKNYVEVVDFKNNIFDDNNYYFLLNFNQGSIPVVCKNEEYITDNIKSNTLLDKTVDINKRNRSDILKMFSRIKNLVVTYKLHSLSGDYSISNINDELKLEVIKLPFSGYNYSNIYNKLRLSAKLDDMIKYNIKDKDIGLLYNNYENIKYLSYDNNFTGLKKEKLNKYLDNKLLLSYSTIDNFNRCGFRYYISNILKLSIYKDNFMTILGNLFHYILEKSLKDNVDIDDEYDRYLNVLDKEFNSKEKFFLNKLKNEIKFIVKTIKLQLEYCNLDEILYEEKIYIDKSRDNNIKITFMGVIDKLMYRKDGDRTICAIIDYKTGNPKIDLNTSIYGIEMQLPIYLYLASNNKKISNVEFAGFYLQKVLNNEIVKDYKNTYEDLKKKNLKLQGYSNEDISILSEFDNSYMDSRIVKNMKTTSKGFSTYAKVLSTDKMKKLIDIVDREINNSIDAILNCDFAINPKKIGLVNYGCEFCQFRDICFKNNNNIVNLKEYKEQEYLEDNEEGK